MLADKSFRHDLGGREFDLYYTGSNLHMVVLHAHGATYWVINTLLDDLSNETMLAIAKGLKPLTSGQVEFGAKWRGWASSEPAGSASSRARASPSSATTS